MAAFVLAFPSRAPASPLAPAAFPSRARRLPLSRPCASLRSSGTPSPPPAPLPFPSRAAARLLPLSRCRPPPSPLPFPSHASAPPSAPQERRRLLPLSRRRPPPPPHPAPQPPPPPPYPAPPPPPLPPPPPPLPSTPPATKTLDPSSSRNRRPVAAAPMRRAFEEISDDEWSHHTFKPSRVLKRPHRAAQPASQPPLEMSGVTSAPWRDTFELDRADVRYLKLRDSAEHFALQLGVCPFRWDPAKSAFVAHPCREQEAREEQRERRHELAAKAMADGEDYNVELGRKGKCLCSTQ